MNAPLMIVGLGNPGRQYEHTRHNIGFDLISEVARRHAMAFGRISRGAQCAEGSIASKLVVLVKPMTFMNLSGEPLHMLLSRRPISPESILAVVDDIHLPLGRLRLRPGGTDGGHNGLKSISAHLHSKDYPRLRIGVGEPASSTAQIDYVLSRFSRSEQPVVSEVLERAADAVEAWVAEGIDAAMNRFNGQ